MASVAFQLEALYVEVSPTVISVLVRTQAVPEHVIVDPVEYVPDLMNCSVLGLTSSSQATSTRKLYLQHLDSFYQVL